MMHHDKCTPLVPHEIGAVTSKKKKGCEDSKKVPKLGWIIQISGV